MKACCAVPGQIKYFKPPETQNHCTSHLVDAHNGGLPIMGMQPCPHISSPARSVDMLSTELSSQFMLGFNRQCLSNCSAYQ